MRQGNLIFGALLIAASSAAAQQLPPAPVPHNLPPASELVTEPAPRSRGAEGREAGQDPDGPLPALEVGPTSAWPPETEANRAEGWGNLQRAQAVLAGGRMPPDPLLSDAIRAVRPQAWWRKVKGRWGSPQWRAGFRALTIDDVQPGGGLVLVDPSTRYGRSPGVRR